MKIVFTTHLPLEGFPNLDPASLVIPAEPYMPHDRLLTEIADADILVSTYDFPVGQDVLETGRHLRLVANFGVGFNNIDIAYCQVHGICVTNTRQPVIEPTAEHCWALVHAIAHRTAELDRKLRLPDYGGIRFGVMNNLGVSLYNKRLGIIGMGRIGRSVARRAIASGMEIVYHNRHRLPLEEETACKAQYVSMDELLSTSDYISLNLPYTPEVHHLIDAAALRKMKPTAILINTARGAHIDEAALAEALQSGKIAGAALDVYENEPAILPALLTLDNVVLSPHIGTGTIDGRLDMCRCVESNILHFLRGEYAQMDIVCGPQVQ